MEIGIGSIVYSKAGRDKENCYIVVACEANNYFLVADGRAKTLAKPKRKNIKHLRYIGQVHDIIAEKLIAKKQVFDSEIKSALRAYKETD